MKFPDPVIINGFKVYPFNSFPRLSEFIADKPTILVAMNPEKFVRGSNELKRIVNSGTGYPDGVGTVLALLRQKVKAIRIPGVELWLRIISDYYQTKSFYIIGSTDMVNRICVEKLEKEYPGIVIKGAKSGYFNEDGEEFIIKDIVEKAPDIVFVAMGSPRQEFFMDKLFQHHKAVYMGLGGSLDIYSGLKKRAPKFFRKLGLEWFFRLLKEPSRIYRQTALLTFILTNVLMKNNGLRKRLNHSEHPVIMR